MLTSKHLLVIIIFWCQFSNTLTRNTYYFITQSAVQNLKSFMYDGSLFVL